MPGRSGWPGALALRDDALALAAEFHRREPVLAVHAALILLLTLPLVAAAFIDGRMFGGVDLWLKPIKFHLALGLYLGGIGSIKPVE